MSKNQKCFSFRGKAKTPSPGALPLDPTGGSAPNPRYRFALRRWPLGRAPTLCG